MASRARKILGLVVKRTDAESAATVLNTKQGVPVESHENFENTFEMVTKSEDHCNKAELTLTNSQREIKRPNISLVPYYDSDITISDNEDRTQYFTTEAESYNEECRVPHLSSSSSSSSTSSSSSSSCSSSSSSDNLASLDVNNSNKANPLKYINPKHNNMTINETDEACSSAIENTPPQNLNLENRRIVLNRCTRDNLNYYTSPVYTDESDVDLSDSDPTFINIEPSKNRNYLINQSSSSSTSSSNSIRANPKKGCKRTKNLAQWKQNKIKRMRNKGRSYVSLAKSHKNVPSRYLKEPCTDKCRLKCTTKINTEDRYDLFKKFWDLGDLAKQRAYISASMMDIQPKYKYTNAERPRHNNKSFHFIVAGNTIRVCKTFFMATLHISNRMIFTIQKKQRENDYSMSDLRGRHQSHRKISPELKAAMREHIQSIPKIESHYLRASTSREYIDGSKTIKDLYIDFKINQEKVNKDAGSYAKYYQIFTSDFNISFFQPKKDQCDLCNSYLISNTDQKKAIEEKYDTHIKEKNYSRIEKHNDRNNINKNSRVAVYDLEAVLQCPRGDSSSFYYKSKLNCYNLTITELTPKECNVAYKNVHCYFWSECDAKRGAIEIGSCVWAYIKSLSDEDDEEKEVIFYSDNCCGQNKNKYITSLYFHAIQTLNIKCITHKFLVRGHTQNEADSVHSLIEKEVKKNLKSGPIYTPDQYITLIKSAKKSKPPLMVHEMNLESFVDLKLLQEEWGYNFTTNTEGESINWNNIKVLKITKENPTSFFYKSSYENQSFKEVNIRNKRKKMKPLSQITIQPAYLEKQQLSENKKKDLKDLIAKGLIPSFYAAFYNSIL